MGQGAPRISLFLEGIDQFSDPLRKAREEMRAYARYYGEVGTKVREVNKQMAQVDKIRNLSKALKEQADGPLKEVTEKLQLMEMAEKAGLLTQQKSFEMIRKLKLEREDLLETMKRSQDLIDRETASLKEQGVAVDNLDESYEQLKKSKQELNAIENEKSAKVKDLKNQEEAARFQKSLEKDRQEQQAKADKVKSDAKEKSLGYMATAGALGFASQRAFGLARQPIQQAMDIEAGITDVIAKGLFDERKNMTPEQLEGTRTKLREQALRLGSELPGYNAGDVVKLQQKAITQGLSLDELSDDFLKKILKFALIDKLDTGNAFDIVNSMRKSYKMPLSDTGRLTDLLAYSSIKSSASTDEMGKAFKEVQGLSAFVNVAPENMASFAALLADKGNIKGERAGTQLKNILTALIVQDNQTAQQLTAMGLDFKDKDGNLLDPVTIIGMIADKTQGWGNANLSKLLVGLGNEEAISGFSNLIRSYQDPNERKDLTMIQDAARSGKITGTVDSVTEGLTQGLSPAVEELTGNIENLKTAIGTPMLGPITEAVKSLNSGLSALTSWFQENPIAGKAAFWGLMAVGITLAVGAVAFLIAALMAIAPVAAGVAGTAMAVTAKVLALIASVVLLWKGISFVLGKVWEIAKGFFSWMMMVIRAAFGGMEQSPNIAQDKDGRFYTKPLPSLTDQEVVKRFRESEKERNKDVFGGKTINMNADITVNATTSGTPEEVGKSVKSETMGGFTDMSGRLFDFGNG